MTKRITEQHATLTVQRADDKVTEYRLRLDDAAFEGWEGRTTMRLTAEILGTHVNNPKSPFKVPFIDETKEETVSNTYVTNPVHDAALKAIKERLDIMQQEGLKRRRELQALVRKQETEREESEERLMTVLLEAQQAGLDLRRVDAVFPVEFDFIKEFWDSVQYFSDLTFKEDEE